jgi:outer membrane protein, heavy metal efflux system
MLSVLSAVSVCSTVIWATAVTAEENGAIKWSDIEVLLDSHPLIQISGNEVAIARAEVGVSRQYPNPEVGVSFGRGSAIEGHEERTIWGVEIEIPIESPGAYWNESEAAQAELQAATNESIITRLEVVRELKSSFYRIAIGQEEVRIMEASKGHLSDLVEVSQRRVELGEARRMELTRLEIEQERVSARSDQTIARIATEREKLNLLLGNQLPANFEVSADWNKLPDLPEFADLKKTVRMKHPRVKSVASRIAAAKARARAQKHRAFPEFKIGCFYDQELDAENYGLSLSMEIPIWNLNLSSIEKSSIELNLARNRMTLFERRLDAELFGIFAAADQSIARARRFNTVILPKARSTAEDMDRLYQVGEIGVTDLLDYRRSLIEIELETLDAFLEGWLAYLELIIMMGGENA